MCSTLNEEKSVAAKRFIKNLKHKIIPLNTKALNSCTMCIVFFLIILIINISIRSVFIYFHWYFLENNINVKFNSNTQTTIYRIHINGKLQRNKLE